MVATVVTVVLFAIAAALYYKAIPKQRKQKPRREKITANTDLRLVYLDKNDELVRLRKMRGDVDKPKPPTVQIDVWDYDTYVEMTRREYREEMRKRSAQ